VNLTFDPRVEDDLAEAAAFYEQRAAGLGEDFLSEVRRAIDEIVHGPERWARVENGPVRRYVLTRFPYAIFYHADTTGVLVLTVTHTRRKPGEWQRRR
jgi:plasmid stabilization system protein ParE